MCCRHARQCSAEDNGSRKPLLLNVLKLINTGIDLVGKQFIFSLYLLFYTLIIYIDSLFYIDIHIDNYALNCNCVNYLSCNTGYVINRG